MYFSRYYASTLASPQYYCDSGAKFRGDVTYVFESSVLHLTESAIFHCSLPCENLVDVHEVQTVDIKTHQRPHFLRESRGKLARDIFLLHVLDRTTANLLNKLVRGV